MNITKWENRVESVLGYLPCGLAFEIRRMAASRRGGVGEIREIRVRAGGLCSFLHKRERIVLYYSPSAEEVSSLVSRLSECALYAQRDSIASGYISLAGGVRVGVCGYAKYEYKSFVGVSDLRSLVFRIPTGECEFADRLYEIYTERPVHGMLIYSLPGVGKTTALRALAAMIGSGRDAKRVAVIDERCEFSEDDYSESEVDILKGYKRKKGIEIATRTMSPEVIMIDEIGADEADGVSAVIRTGVPFIATAHAGSIDELLARPSLSPLYECDAFDLFVGISHAGDGYSLSVDRK